MHYSYLKTESCKLKTFILNLFTVSAMCLHLIMQYRLHHFLFVWPASSYLKKTKKKINFLHSEDYALFSILFLHFFSYFKSFLINKSKISKQKIIVRTNLYMYSLTILPIKNNIFITESLTHSYFLN